MPRLITYILMLFLACTAAGTLLAEPRRLGLSAPLSGGGAGWGNDVKNVLLFANEKLAAGKYSFVFEDDRCDPKTALSVARKFASIDRLKEVFVVCGQAVIAAAKAYRGAGITVMAPLATPSRISELGVFRTSLNDALAARKLAEHIIKTHKSVSVLTEENDYPVSFLNDFLASAEVLGLVVSNENYLAEQTDFRPQLLRLKAGKASALFLNTQTEEALALILRQLKEIEYAPRLFGAYLPGSSNFLKIGATLAEGLSFVDFPGASEMLTSDGQKLFQEFTARFGPLQGWSYAFPATFEAFRAVHLGIASGKPLAEHLKSTTFDGIIGSYTFSTHGDIVGPKHVLRIIRNGKSELLHD